MQPLLRYDPDTLRNATNIDYLLTTLTIVPFVMGLILETPLFDVVTDADRRARLLRKVQPLRQLTSSMLSRTPSQKATTLTARPLEAIVSAHVESAVDSDAVNIETISFDDDARQVRQVRQETSFGAREETHRPSQTFAYLLSRPATRTTSRAFSGRAGAHRGAQAEAAA